MKNRAGGVTQVVGYLPSRPEALNSNPTTAKKKNKTKDEQRPKIHS
jgi:hypothetical protein